jgi:hypothetical protein
VLHHGKTSAEYRQEIKDFTRKRVLTFGRVAILILRGHKISLQNALNKFFGAMGEVFSVPTASALSQARQKIRPELFVRLNEVVVGDFYQLYGADGEVRLWRGHRVVGADGTYLNLPDTPELRREFSVQRNQHRHKQSEQVQALAMVLHDLRNDLGLAAALAPAHSAEKDLLFNQLWGQTRRGDVLVLDRNWADYTVIARAYVDGRQVVIRCPGQSFAAVNEFWESDLTEAILWLPVPTTPKTRAFVREHNLPEEIQVRLLKFTLESGETEVLLTTLCNRRRYPTAEFYTLYGWRWGDETYYDRIKNIFELERFSGLSATAIKQDFYGVIFLATLESVLIKSAQSELSEEAAERNCANTPRVNRAVSYVSLVDRAVELLADPCRSPDQVLEELHHLLKTNPTRHRAGRKFDRPKLTHARKLRFHRYTKRIIA